MTHIATFVNFCGLIVSETRLGTTRDKMLDPLGSVIGEYNDSQTVTGRTEYWPYGEIASETGTLLPSPLKFVGGLGYFRDRIATFLTYIRARWYYPWSTQWTSVDPLWPDEIAYGYVRNTPTIYKDPTGLSCQIEDNPCSQLKGIYGACVAALCSAKSVYDMVEYLKEVLKIKNLPKWIKKFLENYRDKPNFSPVECCKSVSGNHGPFSIEAIIAWICNWVKSNGGARICRKRFEEDDDFGCNDCCDKLFRRASIEWQKCRDYCAGADGGGP